MYQSSVAYDLSQNLQPQQEARPSFEVVDGGGLDAEARRGVSVTFVARFAAVMAAAALFIATGAVRVWLCAETVQELSQVNMAKAAVDEVKSLNADLKMERSTLSNPSRIERIASQNYGMVRATSSEALTLTTPSK